jgi:hypothetical protein
LSEGLVRGMTAREIQGILAHEVVHARNGDIALMQLAMVVGLTRNCRRLRFAQFSASSCALFQHRASQSSRCWCYRCCAITWATEERIRFLWPCLSHATQRPRTQDLMHHSYQCQGLRPCGCSPTLRLGVLDD